MGLSNPFEELIRAGRISSEEELKAAYRAAAKKSHPDLNSEKDKAGDFAELRENYDEALVYLKENPPADSGIAFFAYWEELENLELPFNKTRANRERRERLAVLMARSFAQWHPDRTELYCRAMDEYNRIKEEKPPNDLAHLRKPLLYTELKPFIYDLCRYSTAGRPLHGKLLERMGPALRKRMKDEGHHSLCCLFEFLCPY